MNLLKPVLLLALVPVGLLAQEPPAYSGAQYSDNVVIVLDASGSMKGQMPDSRDDKMTAAKAALKTVMKTVPETTHIGLLVFSAKNLRDPWAYPLGPREDQRLTAAIDRPLPYGSTPLGKYLKIGADRLLEAREKQYGYGTYRLLIVTDGEANDTRLVKQYSRDIWARGVVLDVIGVDMKQDHTLADLAHSYRSANDPLQLETAIRETFAEISTDTDEGAMDEAFETIAPLPENFAKAALEALSISGNHPIGERHPDELKTTNTAPGANSAPAPGSSSAPTPAPVTVSEETNFSAILKIGIVAFLIALVLLFKFKRS